jgi:hypothetical protein
MVGVEKAVVGARDLDTFPRRWLARELPPSARDSEARSAWISEMIARDAVEGITSRGYRERWATTRRRLELLSRRCG